eukprot:210436_1
MVHAVWHKRPIEDLFREFVIYCVVIILFIRGFQLRSFVIMIISIVIIIQHGSILLYSQDLISDNTVLFGSCLLTIVGYYYKSLLISFAGTYSVLSKYNWCTWCDRKNDMMKEIVKLLVSILVWTICNVVIYRKHLQEMLSRKFKPKRINKHQEHEIENAPLLDVIKAT